MIDSLSMRWEGVWAELQYQRYRLHRAETLAPKCQHGNKPSSGEEGGVTGSSQRTEPEVDTLTSHEPFTSTWRTGRSVSPVQLIPPPPPSPPSPSVSQRLFSVSTCRPELVSRQRRDFRRLRDGSCRTNTRQTDLLQSKLKRRFDPDSHRGR